MSQIDHLPGKTVARHTYFHVSMFLLLPVDVQLKIESAERLADVVRDQTYNVVRLDPEDGRLSLLYYPNFFDFPFPSLRASWTVDIGASRVSYRTYEESLNPPILHRKELLIPPDHPRYAEYSALTEAAESIGLFDDTSRIGYLRQWEILVKTKGYQVVGHELVPVGNVESENEFESSTETEVINRHLTALVRYGFSAPIQTLARYGFLDGRFSIFDYGCGRGDDVRGLTENGLKVSGWDPHFAPENPVVSADIVNLGFVINVIEDMDERVDALCRAYSLAAQFLVVSVMLTNQNALEGRRFADGIVTRRQTFQKYYTQAEFKGFLESVLHEVPIAVSPGVFYVFRDKDAEQRFLTERFRRRRVVLRDPVIRLRERPVRVRADRAEQRYQAYREPLDRLWNKWVEIGRVPDKGEVEDLPAILEGFGTLPKALRFIEGRNDIAEVEISRQNRIQDLQVYFALNGFERRKPYKHLEQGLQRDIKAFFGDYSSAWLGARDLLFQIAKPDVVNAACREAAERGLGYFLESESLQLHASMVEQLPALLRVYVGCASVLYGDYRGADLIKVHIRSGKLTLMRFDDFLGKPLPRMIERVKIKLREQDVDYFLYGEDYEPPFLFQKSRYMNEEMAGFPEQIEFENKLERLGLFDLSGFGPSPREFMRILDANRWEIEGFSIRRSSSIPGLDDPCGKRFKYRDLIECGETQAASRLANLPKSPDSYNALYALATNILDPIADYFGMLRLTYGFCSPELGKHIKRRVAPRLDQHASHEKTRTGKYICERLGAAVDFLVEDEDMEEVARWVMQNTSFDRLYFYGKDRPIHVSYSENPAHSAFQMVEGTPGQLYPRPFV